VDKLTRKTASKGEERRKKMKEELYSYDMIF
jgi:hypothetical protein